MFNDDILVINFSIIISYIVIFNSVLLLVRCYTPFFRNLRQQRNYISYFGGFSFRLRTFNFLSWNPTCSAKPLVNF